MSNRKTKPKKQHKVALDDDPLLAGWTYARLCEGELDASLNVSPGSIRVIWAMRCKAVEEMRRGRENWQSDFIEKISRWAFDISKDVANHAEQHAEIGRQRLKLASRKTRKTRG